MNQVQTKPTKAAKPDLRLQPGFRFRESGVSKVLEVTSVEGERVNYRSVDGYTSGSLPAYDYKEGFATRTYQPV